MDSILQEISKEDAVRRYLDGEDIQVLRPTQSGRLAMWSLNELFQGSRFLVNSCSKNSPRGSEDVDMPTKCEVDLGDPGFTNVIDDLFESDSHVSTSISNEDLHDKISGSEMTQQGDVILETADKEKKRRVRVDLGKFRSLKEAGWKRKDIAEELHCSIGTVNNYWHKV